MKIRENLSRSQEFDSYEHLQAMGNMLTLAIARAEHRGDQKAIARLLFKKSELIRRMRNVIRIDHRMAACR